VIGKILFVVFLWAVSSLCAWNLIGGFRNGVIYVRTTEYAAKRSKAWFWFAVLANVPLTIIALGLAVLTTLSLLGLV
jgi:hypothetical protein